MPIGTRHSRENSKRPERGPRHVKCRVFVMLLESVICFDCYKYETPTSRSSNSSNREDCAPDTGKRGRSMVTTSPALDLRSPTGARLELTTAFGSIDETNAHLLKDHEHVDAFDTNWLAQNIF